MLIYSILQVKENGTTANGKINFIKSFFSGGPKGTLINLANLLLILLQVVTIMSRTLHDLVVGELQQLTTKSERDDRFQTYMKKTYNKTASLMANSCQAVAQMASTASNTGLA